MTPAEPDGSSGREDRILLALFIAGLSLRPTIVAIGPLAELLGPDLGVGRAAIGLLTTLPILGMGVFATLGPRLARRIGPNRAMTACLAGVVAASLVRVVAPTFGWALLGSVGLGLAIGAAGSLPAMLAGLHRPNAPGQATGIAVAGIVVGAVVGSAAAIPLADLLGGWRGATLVLTLVILACLAGWVLLVRPDPRAAPSAPRVAPQPRARDPLAIGLLVAFGLQALVYWGAGAWLVGTLVERGQSAQAAGGLLGALNLAASAATLTAAALSDQLGGRSRQLVAASLVLVGGLAGLLALPAVALAWVVILGLGLGLIFPILLALSVDQSSSPAAAGELASFMLTGGYTIAALGPFGLGLIRDLTGSFVMAFIALVGVGLALVAISFWLTQLAGARR